MRSRRASVLCWKVFLTTLPPEAERLPNGETDIQTVRIIDEQSVIQRCSS